MQNTILAQGIDIDRIAAKDSRVPAVDRIDFLSPFRGCNMKTWIAAALLAGITACAVAADDKPEPKPAKKPQLVAIDAAKAGPDFAFQGEYTGQFNDLKFGVQVIAEGDGRFAIRV